MLRFHLVCQDCKEVKGNKKCSCTKPIEEFKDENVESGVCDDVDEYFFFFLSIHQFIDFRWTKLQIKNKAWTPIHNNDILDHT